MPGRQPTCHKCGGYVWEKLTEEDYSCTKCGNLLYYILNEPVQQIDLTMRSARGKEYVRTTRGTLVPRYDETIENLRFQAVMERRKAA